MDVLIYLVAGAALLIAVFMAYSRIDAETTLQIAKWCMVFNRHVARLCQSNYIVVFWIVVCFGSALYFHWGNWTVALFGGSLSSLINILITVWLGNFLDKYGG